MVLFIRQPIFELEEDLAPCSLQAPLSVPGTVTGIRGVAHTVEKVEVSRFLFVGQHMQANCQRVELTINRQLFS